jgi:hypothetical protein
VLSHTYPADREATEMESTRLRAMQDSLVAAQRHFEIVDLAAHLNVPPEALQPFALSDSYGIATAATAAFESNERLYLVTEPLGESGTIFYHAVQKFGSAGGYETDAHEIRLAGGAHLTLTGAGKGLLETATDQERQPLTQGQWQKKQWEFSFEPRERDAATPDQIRALAHTHHLVANMPQTLSADGRGHLVPAPMTVLAVVAAKNERAVTFDLVNPERLEVRYFYTLPANEIATDFEQLTVGSPVVIDTSQGIHQYTEIAPLIDDIRDLSDAEIEELLAQANKYERSR